MKFTPIFTACALVAAPLSAEQTRQLGAHEHGVGQLDIAVEGDQIAMTLHAPGADIVGFEYAATSAEDIAAIETALETLKQPLALFTMPGAANCTVTDAHSELESEDDHDDHAAEHKGEDDHDDHSAEAGHTEFHAEYLLTCENVKAATQITFAYFDAFANALEVEVQVISDTGATAFEVERDAPTLDLDGVL